MDLRSFERIDNNKYVINLTDSHELVITCNYSDINKKTIFEKIFKGINETEWNDLLEGHYDFELNGNFYTLTKKEENTSLSQRFFSSLLPEFFLSETTIPHFELVPSRQAHLEDIQQFTSEIHDLWIIDPETLKVVRSNLIQETVERGLFNDPYTQLASHAFQFYDIDFTQNNAYQNYTSDLIITKLKGKNNHYVLENINHEIKPGKYQDHHRVVKEYYQYLIHLWGQKKVLEVEYRYGIDFRRIIEENRPLSIDLVYKMNIGFGCLTIHEVQDAYLFLQGLLKKLERMDTQESLLSWVLKTDNPVYLKILLYNSFILNKENPLVEDLSRWIKGHSFLKNGPSDCRELEADQFQVLMSVVEFKEIEKERMYTGRKVIGYLKGSYSQADTTIYKPWVDEQEFAQCCDTLKGNSSWNFFAQELAFVICKKHLVFPRPDGTYTVGSIVPAPLTINGEQHYFEITNCINSGTGNFSYILEPACLGTELPIIKLYRSTASDEYAFDSMASVRSNLNPLNAPGYLGRHLIHKYESPLFKERTIPLWVAYQSMADEVLNSPPGKEVDKLETVYNYLFKAHEELLEEEKRSYEVLDFRQLLKHYDWIVIQVFIQVCTYENLNAKDRLAFYKLIKKYGYGINEKIPDTKTQLNDAKFLYDFLTNRTTKTFELQLICRIIKERVLNFNHSIQDSVIQFEQFKDEFFTTRFLQKYEKALKNLSNPIELQKILRHWSLAINEYAVKQGEAVVCKTKQNIVVIGHSLGGAIAQRSFAEYTLLSRRIPLSGFKIELYDFYSPAINQEEADAFIKIGNKHSDLLEKWNGDTAKSFLIHRTHIKGDFFVLGGASHLGKISNYDEHLLSEKWLEFEGNIFSPVSGVQTIYAHGQTVYEPVYLKKSKEMFSDKTRKHFIQIPFDKNLQHSFNLSPDSLRSMWKMDNLSTKIAQFEKSTFLFRLIFISNLKDRPLQVLYRFENPFIVVDDRRGLISGHNLIVLNDIE